MGIHWDSNSQTGSSYGSVGVQSFTLSYIFGSMKCDSQLHSWLTPLQVLALVMPKVRVTTHTTRIDHNWKVAKLVLCTWFYFILKFQFLKSSSEQNFKQFISNCKCCLRCPCAFLSWPHVLFFYANFVILFCESRKHGLSMPSLPNFMANF